MAKKLQDLVLVSEVGSDAVVLMKQDEGVGLRDLQIRVSDFLNGYLTTALLGTAIGQVPQLIDNGSGTPAFPAVSGEFLTNVTDAVVVGSDLVQGKVFLSDSLVSNNGVSNGTAATPKAVKDMGELKLSLTGGALTGDVSTNSAFIYENGAVTQIRLLDTSLKTIQSYSSGTNTITVGNIDLNAEITGLDLTFTDLAGTHTVYHTGNAVTIADYEAFATTEQEFNRSREMVSEENAASGFVHFGKHNVSATSVNEGITCSPSLENHFRMGRTDNASDNSEASKTGNPIINIAGVVTELFSINHSVGVGDTNRVKFPDAPDGTVTYDSATGAITDFTADVDPKYGDVAGTLNEAVARAFEGDVKNGDFRNGTTEWSAGNSALYSVTNGVMTITNNGSTNGQVTTAPVDGTTSNVILEVVVVDKSSAPNARCFYKNTSSSLIFLDLNEGVNRFVISDFSLTARSVALQPQTNASAEMQVSNVSVRPATNEVVTERVDHFGLEGFLEEVTNTKPYIYPNGLIQSQATSMNGITTVATNRPASYYAVFDGDTTSSGLGVHFYNLSEADKLLVLGDSKNNLFRLADGRLVQFRIRQRTIAGAGNGDWATVQPILANPQRLCWDTSTNVPPQGALDSVGGLTPNSPSYRVTENVDNLHPQQGAFTIDSLGDYSAIAVNGECYWLPLGTVTRLNQGGFHPFNPLGTKYAAGGNFWYQNNNFVDKASCFVAANLLTNSGNISSGLSARTNDGRFYDAIYADGQGGVVDLRLSAQGGTISDILGTEDAKTKNGTQRGLQKLVRSLAADVNYAGRSTQTGSTSNLVYDLPANDLELPQVGSKVLLEFADGDYYERTILAITTGVSFTVQGSVDEPLDRFANQLAVFTEELNLSVAGEFTQTDVIGDPAQILATPDFANGWLGNWISTLATGANLDFPMVRKSLVSSADVQSTNNNGSSWSTSTRTIDQAKNTWNITLPVNDVVVFNYTAHAYMTEAADNPMTYRGTEGIGHKVFSSINHSPDFGCLLMESLIGEIPKGSGNPNTDYSQLLSYLFDGRDTTYGLNVGNDYSPKHTPFDILLPPNDSHGCKSLPLVAEENGQLFLYYLSTELIWDTTLDNGAEFFNRVGVGAENYTADEWYHITSGRFEGYYQATDTLNSFDLDASTYYQDSDGNIRTAGGDIRFIIWAGNGWGDDNLITVLDGEDTKTDLNGNTVKVSCHKVPYPLQWVRNTI